MARFNIATLLGAVCLHIGPVVTLSAEPITANYAVHVVLRESYATGAVETFTHQFTLRLIYDTDPMSLERGPYGPPMFSQVPLPLPSPPPGLPLSRGTGTGHSVGIFNPDLKYTLHAIATDVTSSPDRTNLTQPEYFRILQLEALVHGLSNAPPTTAGRFAHHLGMVNERYGGLFNFLYAGYLVTGPVGPEGNYAANSYVYFGNATLIGGPSPVPEPTSLLLLGSGLAAIGLRRWRNIHRG